MLVTLIEKIGPIRLGRAGAKECAFLQVALYSFTSNNEAELSFEKGDRLEIVERPPSDPEWYRARDSRGQLGLVPRNYLQELADYLAQPYWCAAFVNPPFTDSGPRFTKLLCVVVS